MELWQVILLAAVQGLTEFLPISSSGHLVIIEHLPFIDIETDLTLLNVTLHAGTLGSILVFYRKSILNLLRKERNVIWLLAIGTLPAIVAGLALEGIERISGSSPLESPLIAGLMLPITGAMLLWMIGRDGELDYVKLTPKQALIIGVFQAFALLPGVSRSGSTIVAGLLVGLKRPAAATFSFLLAIPAISLATGYETQKLIRDWNPDVQYGLLVIGAAVAFAVGLVALWIVVKMLNQGRLYWFAFWCIPLGVAIVGWQIYGMLHR